MRRLHGRIRLLSCVLLLALLLTVPPARIHAQEQRFVTMNAQEIKNGKSGTLILLENNGEAYIDVEDAMHLACADGCEDLGNGKGHVFSFDRARVRTPYEGVKINGSTYYPLKELMDTLRCVYVYDETQQTLLVQPGTAYANNLYMDCEEIYQEGFSLTLIENKAGAALGAAFNIIGDLRVDALWGAYQKEKYEEIVAGILQTKPDEAVELVSLGDELSMVMTDTWKGLATAPDGSRHNMPVYGIDGDGFAEAYDRLNEMIPGIEVGDVWGILQRIKSAQDAEEIYVNAVRQCLTGENARYGADALYDAADEVMNYYDKNKPTAVSVVEDVIGDVISGVAADQLTSEFIREEIYKKVGAGTTGSGTINAAYVKLAKVMAEQIFSMDGKTKAAEQTVICSEIQRCARKSYLNSFKTNAYGAVDGKAAVQMKYATILYLRACQYAYSLYEFDKDLRSCAEYWKSKTQEKIELLASYDDDELRAKFDNPYLDLDADGIEELDPAYDGPKQMANNTLNADGWTQCVLLKRSTVRETADGWTFEGDVYEPVRFSNEYVQSLQVGDEVYGVIVDGFEERYAEWRNSNILVIDQMLGNYLCYEPNDDCWYLYGVDDSMVREYTETKSFHVLRGYTQIYDGFSLYASPAHWEIDTDTLKKNDLYDCLNARYEWGGYMWGGEEGGFVTVTMQSGKMTELVFEYQVP